MDIQNRVVKINLLCFFINNSYVSIHTNGGLLRAYESMIFIKTAFLAPSSER